MKRREWEEKLVVLLEKPASKPFVDRRGQSQCPGEEEVALKKFSLLPEQGESAATEGGTKAIGEPLICGSCISRRIHVDAAPRCRNNEDDDDDENNDENNGGGRIVLVDDKRFRIVAAAAQCNPGTHCGSASPDTPVVVDDTTRSVDEDEKVWPPCPHFHLFAVLHRLFQSYRKADRQVRLDLNLT
ncbi:hypothetical protein KM043_005316 [Ampulex compressa]|nr:hypothetical protein KM043_005316 [Ampulex compressa]